MQTYTMWLRRHSHRQVATDIFLNFDPVKMSNKKCLFWIKLGKDKKLFYINSLFF